MYRIAVIEDHLETNDLFAKMLREILPDSEVLQYQDFESASKAINGLDPGFDLVVSDVDLGPGTDKLGGVKIARELDTKRIPLLIISGAPEYEFQRDVFRALDAWDYLQKPVATDDFEKEVRRAIAFREGQKGSDGSTAKRSNTTFPLVPDLVINRGERGPIQWKGKKTHLPMSSIDIVEHLARNAGNTVTYEELYNFIPSGKNKENLRVKIHDIKEAFKIDDNGFDRIKAVVMTGYVWQKG